MLAGTVAKESTRIVSYVIRWRSFGELHEGDGSHLVSVDDQLAIATWGTRKNAKVFETKGDAMEVARLWTHAPPIAREVLRELKSKKVGPVIFRRVRRAKP